jgi:hypothetical protein
MTNSTDPRVQKYLARRAQLQTKQKQQSAQLANFKATQAQAKANAGQA